MLLVAATPVFAYAFVGSNGILAVSIARPAELNFYFRDWTGDHSITAAELT